MLKGIRLGIERWVARTFGTEGMNRLGVQFQWDDEEVVRYNEVVWPRAWMSITVIKRDFLERVYEANPGAFRIFRAYPDSDWEVNPEQRAWEHVSKLTKILTGRLHLFDGLVDNNEYVFPFDVPERVEAADRYMARFVELCAGIGKKAVVLNAATGNWGDDIVRFPRMLEALREYGGYLGFHEYDWPTMWRAHEEGILEGNEGMWHCLRWKRAARAIRAAYDGWCPQFIITECGLERAVIDGIHGGFRTYAEDLEQSVAHYVESLRWYNGQLNEDVFAALIFGCGMVSPWQGFDVARTTVPDQVKLFPVPEPGPNGGGNMDIQVYDMEYKKRDLEWAEGKYGVRFRRAAAQPGKKVYRLVILQEQRGNSSLKTTVLDEDGQPMENADVAFYWADAPDPPDPPTNVVGYDWHGNFVHGPTDMNGVVGPGMGSGAYHGEGEGGPHAVWVRDAEIPSDICERLGMLAGTPHDHLDQTFQLVGESGSEPEDGELEVEFLQRVEEEWPRRMLGMAVVAETEAEKAWLFDTRGEGAGPGVDELIGPQEWLFMGMRCLLVEVCCDFQGDPGEEREYAISLVRLENGHVAETLIEPVTEMVKRLGEEEPRRSVYVYRLVEGVEPPPDDEPEPEEGEWVVDLRVTGTIRRKA